MTLIKLFCFINLLNFIINANKNAYINKELLFIEFTIHQQSNLSPSRIIRSVGRTLRPAIVAELQQLYQICPSPLGVST